MKESLVGKTFGRLTVLSRAEDRLGPSNGWYTQYLCRCTCGNECVKVIQSLKRGREPSCGCAIAEQWSVPVALTPTPPVIVQPSGVMPIPEGCRESRPVGYIIRIGEEIWTAGDCLRGILEYAVETAQARRTTLCFSNGVETKQVRDYREVVV